MAGGRGGIFPPPRLCPAKTAGRLFFCLLFPASPCYNIGEKQNMRQISGLRPPEILRRCHNHLHNGPRPHRMDDIIQFFQTLCKGFPCFARLKDCLLSESFSGVLQGQSVHRHFCLLTLSCRAVTCTAFLFFPDPLGGSWASPGVWAGERYKTAYIVVPKTD